ILWQGWQCANRLPPRSIVQWRSQLVALQVRLVNVGIVEYARRALSVPDNLEGPHDTDGTRCVKGEIWVVGLYSHALRERVGMKVAACRADKEGRYAPCAHTVAPRGSYSLRPLRLRRQSGPV